MSIIQQIRDKAAWILIVAIAVALIGFLVQDAFQNRSGVFSSNSTTIGSVNGKKLEAIEFDQRVKSMEDRYSQSGYPMDESLRQNAKQQAWNQFVDETLINEEYKKLGLEVSDKELNDMLFVNTPPDIKQSFTNPQTGVFDVNVLKQQLDAIRKQKDNAGRNQLNAYLIEMINNRLRQKYNALIANSSYLPKWMLEKMNADNSQMASISFVGIPYSTIVDSTVKVSDDDINTYLNKHKDAFKQEESRSIAYVAFSAAPSTADSNSVKEKLASLKNDFATTTDIKALLVREGSELPYYEGKISGKRLQQLNKDSLTSIPVGSVYGPYLDQNNYVLARMIDKRQWPDTAKVRHILIGTVQRDPQTGQAYPIRTDSAAKKLADSVKNVIAAGSNFDSLVAKLSDDQRSKQTNGVYDNVVTGQMTPSFNEYIFGNPVGTKGIVKTEYGYHYVEILSQKGSSTAYQIAYLSKPIITSPETENAASGLANEFAGESRNAKAFDENVIKKHYVKLPATDIKPTDNTIPGAGVSRDLVKWIYEADKGDVSQPFSLGDKFVVATVTEINKEGIMSAAKARPQVEMVIRNQKKAEQIKKKIGTPTSLQAVATANNVQVMHVDSISFATSFAPNIGQEPKVVGAAFNKQWQGKVSPALEGLGAVFVIQPEKVYAISTSTDIEQQRNSMSMQYRQMAYTAATAALRKSASIKDNRAKFY